MAAHIFPEHIFELVIFFMAIFLIFHLIRSEWLLGSKQPKVEEPCDELLPPQFLGYSTDVPHGWRKKFPNACGNYQSPINIRQKDILPIKKTTREVLNFNCKYWELPCSTTLHNDGFCVQLGMEFDREWPTIRGGPLKHAYRFNSATFRWGYNDYEGSEHTINSQRFAMELQMMHIKGDHMYQSLDDAARHEALLFVSCLFDVTPNDNPFLSPIVDRLDCIQKPHVCLKVDPFPLSWLFQPFKRKYYHYNGSLTNPPCTEGVDWIIFADPLSISRRQLKAFRQLKAVDGPMTWNTRPVQEVNNRLIQYFM